MEAGGSSKVAPAVIQTLKARGWCIEDDNNQLKALIVIQTALSDDINDASAIVNSVESELLNTDLKSIGAKSLPDSNKTSDLHGPKILQISSVRDISMSSVGEGYSDSSNRRLLKFTFTDGHNEITAIEYSHIPSIPNDVVPGAKVRLENKVPRQSGILCLNPKVITLLGGVVQSLYEEWQMQQKYFTLSRSSIRLSREMESNGPPQFEKLQIRAPSHRSYKHADYVVSSSNSSLHDGQQRHNIIDDSERTESIKEQIGEGPRVMEVMVQSGTARDQATPQKHLQDKSHPNQNARGRKYREKDKQEVPQVFTLAKKIDISQSTFKSNVPAGSAEIRHVDKQPNADDFDDTMTPTSLSESVEQKPSTSDTRPKEVAELAPVQNQAAAQKLLQKMGKPNQIDRYSKGRRHKGKGKQAEQQVFTLDEWEKQKTGAKPPMRNDLPDVSYDENLAWQLQNQLDMEDSYDHQIQMRTNNKVTDDIRMSMFSYERDDGTERGRGWGRGRGGGRGRGKGRYH